MTRLITYLRNLLHRLEVTAVGDTEKVMSPLTKMFRDLRAIESAGLARAADARTEAAAVVAHAEALEAKAKDAADKANKLSALIG